VAGQLKNWAPPRLGSLKPLVAGGGDLAADRRLPATAFRRRAGGDQIQLKPQTADLEPNCMIMQI
jgi:hypothetical protein